MTPKMGAFLKYVSGRMTEDPFVKRLDEAVGRAKSRDEWRVEYMTILMRDREMTEKGFQQGLEKGIEQGLEQGIEQGLERGIRRGREEGLEKGIKRGREEGLEQGIRRGREEGIEKGLLAAAAKMLKKGYTTDEIKSLTGISDEKLDKLRAAADEA